MLNANSAIIRRPFKPGIDLSIVGFGGVLLCRTEQDECNRMVVAAVERGINYFDVAPFYGNGEAEEKMGPALESFRKDVFLACKSMDRTAPGSRMELERSLRRLRTDHFDLYQFHSVKTVEEVEQMLGPGGAGETLLKAREEGKVRFLGFSAHSAAAALALMGRFPLDSVLFPVNYVCYAQGNFGPQILARAKALGMARLALKAMAKGPWPESLDRTARKYDKCWYEPHDGATLVRQSVRFTLSEDITAMVPPGDARLFEMALTAAETFTPMSAEEREAMLGSTVGMPPLFRA
jgi:predicted aldo/keto reductase-like oxidoreductase